MDNAKLVRGYWALMCEGRFEEAGTLMAEDAAVWFPNTREVFRGRDAFVAFNRAYPGKWRMTIEKIFSAGDTVVTAVRVGSEDTEISFYAASFFTVRYGLIQEITEYWGENTEPPQWRTEKGISERY